jgi:flavin-dependent dehydrogenase
VARSLFGEPFDRKHIGFALEMEVPRSAAAGARSDPEIYFGLLPWGYGWVFPKADTLTAGVGGLHRLNPDMRPRFEAFLRQRFGARAVGKVKGHYIPFGTFREDPAADNILLCGDAAGLVEPITGEGIAFAMQSGALAGRAILQALRAGEATVAADLYRRDYRQMTDALKSANALRFLLFPRLAQYLFSRALPRTRSIPRKHLDLMADQLSHRDYVRFLMGKAASGMVGALLGRRSRHDPGALPADGAGREP